MTKAERREINICIKTYAQMGMLDTVARSLSALIRASMSKKSRAELLEHAERFGVTNHPEFII